MAKREPSTALTLMDDHCLLNHTYFFKMHSLKLQSLSRDAQLHRELGLSREHALFNLVDKSFENMALSTWLHLFEYSLHADGTIGTDHQECTCQEQLCQ